MYYLKVGHLRLSYGGDWFSASLAVSPCVSLFVRRCYTSVLHRIEGYQVNLGIGFVFRTSFSFVCLPAVVWQPDQRSSLAGWKIQDEKGLG